MSFWIGCCVAESSEQVDLLVHEGETVAEPSTRRWTVARSLRPKLLPLPLGSLQLVEIAGVFAILQHATMDQQPRVLHHEAERYVKTFRQSSLL